jgi:hypothetical protein
MSTNDDSASRRARRAGQGAPERRAPVRQDRDDRWDQSSSRDRDAADPYNDQRSRDSQPPRGYSGFSRHSYAPPPAQQPRSFEPAPPSTPQGYYPDPVQRNDPPRPYSEPSASPYAPPQQAYEPELPPAFNDAGRDDLFGQEPAPPGYDQSPYGRQQSGGYHADPYDQNPQRQPMMQPAAGRRDDGYFQRDAPSPLDDYERSFAARIAAQESQASRFFLPEDQAQSPQQRSMPSDRGYQPAMPQAPVDRGYAPTFSPSAYNPSPELPQSYGQDHYDARYAGQETWAGDEHGLHDDGRENLPQRVGHRDELDEDFFADEDELDHDPYQTPRRGRKKLIAAALVGAIAVGGGGAYAYKTLKSGGGENATPFIRADPRPSKEMPGNPGGRQFPNGEKAIYDRLGPDGQQTRVASVAPLPSANTAPAAGNSLEDRIEEALKKAHNTGDAPQPGRPGPDQPTVVRSESYRPDGTRVDAGRPMITPNIVNVNGGQLPPPFGNAPTPPVMVQTQTAAPLRPASPAPPPQLASMAPPPKSAPATRSASLTPAPEAAPVAAGGFYVSLKSAPDEKALQRELPALTDKFKSVLGDVSISTRVVDLGAKGVMYRASAGPLGSKQEANDLCQKIKGAGGACFVTN